MSALINSTSLLTLFAKKKKKIEKRLLKSEREVSKKRGKAERGKSRIFIVFSLAIKKSKRFFLFGTKTGLFIEK